MANEKTNFIVTFSQTKQKINLNVLSDNLSLYGIFHWQQKTDSGVFVADQTMLEDYRTYVRIDLTYGDFNSNKRRRPTAFAFEYAGELAAFGENILQGYARTSLANPELCTIEKVKEW